MLGSVRPPGGGGGGGPPGGGGGGGPVNEDFWKELSVVFRLFVNWPV